MSAGQRGLNGAPTARSRARKRRLLALLVAAALLGCGGSAGRGEAPPAPPAEPSAPAGTIKRLSVPSAALGRAMPVSVYLPAGYTPASVYPVLYMFYGYGGNQDSYFSNPLSMQLAADRLIANGSIAPLIIVVPAYDNSFGVNATLAQQPESAGGSIGSYEDYLIGELLPYVESSFAVDRRRERRYIGGVSMGGFAALHLGLRHPDLFGKIGAHSAALWNYGPADQFIGQRNWLYASPALRAQRDPFLLAEGADLRGLKFYLDAGADDALRVQDQALHQLLVSRGAASEWHVGNGGHNMAYWSASMPAWLSFYGKD